MDWIMAFVIMLIMATLVIVGWGVFGSVRLRQQLREIENQLTQIEDLRQQKAHDAVDGWIFWNEVVIGSADRKIAEEVAIFALAHYEINDFCRNRSAQAIRDQGKAGFAQAIRDLYRDRFADFDAGCRVLMSHGVDVQSLLKYVGPV